MKKIIANLLVPVTVLPFLLIGNDVLAQERNFKSSCSLTSRWSATDINTEKGKCQIKTYIEGDYLIVEVNTPWGEAEKDIIRLKNNPSCQYWSWSDTEVECKSFTPYTASEDANSFHYGMGNAYMVDYDGPLLRPSNSATQNSDQNQASSNPDDACMSTVDQIAKQIYDYGSSVDVRAFSGANDWHQGNPSNTDIQLILTLGGSYLSKSDDSIIYLLHESKNANNAKENILKSFQLQQNWADKIVEKCNVAVVSFLEDQSDYIIEYAIQSNGLTKQRDCLSEDVGDSVEMMPWNYAHCL